MQTQHKISSFSVTVICSIVGLLNSACNKQNTIQPAYLNEIKTSGKPIEISIGGPDERGCIPGQYWSALKNGGLPFDYPIIRLQAPFASNKTYSAWGATLIFSENGEQAELLHVFKPSYLGYYNMILNKVSSSNSQVIRWQQNEFTVEKGLAGEYTLQVDGVPGIYKQ